MGSFKEEGFSPLPPLSLLPPPCSTAAIEELTKGQEIAARLAGVLLWDDPRESHKRELSKEARLLLREIMEKISKAITVLGSGKEKHDHMIGHRPSPDASNKGSGMKRKMQSTRKASNRKRGNPYSWKTTSTSTADGHLWRKYGQKQIYTAKYPRSYYRCTHKYDRGCMATRQVQQSEEDPFLYVINYFGEHTCESVAKNTNTSTAIISFESNATVGIKREAAFASIPPHKQEIDEDVLSNLTCIGSPSAYFMSPELALQKAPAEEFESGPREMQSDLQPWASGYDLDIFYGEEIFNFDHNELFQL